MAAIAILAVVATLALSARASWAIPIVWVFNVWGAVDLLNAVYQGQIGVRVRPESLGAAFYISTVVVPAASPYARLIFWLLLRPKEYGAAWRTSSSRISISRAIYSSSAVGQAARPLMQR
jgi:hypothetical protein